MKSIILCAGRGARASGYTDRANKCLTEIPGYGTIADYSLKTALELTGDVIVLVGYKAPDVRNYVLSYVNGCAFDGKISFAEQQQLSGLCDGILCCEPLLDGEDFLLFLGDEIITDANHTEMIKTFHDNNALSACGFVYAGNKEDVKKTYSIELCGQVVRKITEKPDIPVNDMMGTGNCVFRNSFCGYIRCYKSKADNRTFSFPDVLMYAINEGQVVVASEIGKTYLNFNSDDDLTVFLSRQGQNDL